MQNSANKAAPYMTPYQRRTLNELFGKLVRLLLRVEADPEVKGKARSIVDYYLYNPFTARQADFFDPKLCGIKYTASHAHAADHRYVPMLTFLLDSNFQLYERQLEQLTMLKGLDFQIESIPTPSQVEIAFVHALAAYTEVDHTNYDQLNSMMTVMLVGVDYPHPTNLKDLAT